MSAIGRSIKALCVLSAVFALVAAARAEEVKIPSTIKLIVGYPPGGSVDTVARLIAQPLSKELGTTVVVDNRPGAGGRIAAGIVHNSPADGSVMMLAPNALTTVQTLVYEGKLGYDMLKDFQPVSRIASYPFALSVSAQSGIQSPSDLAAWLREHPEQANFGSSSAGGTSHFAGLMYGKAASVDWTHIAFKGGAPLLNNLIGGHVVAGVDTLIDHIEYSRSGKLRILGIFSPQRSPLAPEIPTLAEGGVEGLNVSGWFGAFVPAGTPRATVARLDQAFAKTLADAAFAAKLNALVIEPAYLSSDAFTRLQQDELRQWAPVVRDSGFSPE